MPALVMTSIVVFLIMNYDCTIFPRMNNNTKHLPTTEMCTTLLIFSFKFPLPFISENGILKTTYLYRTAVWKEVWIL